MDNAVLCTLTDYVEKDHEEIKALHGISEERRLPVLKESLERISFFKEFDDKEVVFRGKIRVVNNFEDIRMVKILESLNLSVKALDRLCWAGFSKNLHRVTRTVRVLDTDNFIHSTLATLPEG